MMTPERECKTYVWEAIVSHADAMNETNAPVKNNPLNTKYSIPEPENTTFKLFFI